MTRHLVSSVLLCILIGGGHLFAQDIAVRTLALKSGAMPEFYLKGAENHHVLEFSATQPGEIVRALRASPLPLYRKELNDDGEANFVVAQKVKVPAGANGILLLGWKSGDETRP